jgi:hypothetical protein
MPVSRSVCVELFVPRGIPEERVASCASLTASLFRRRLSGSGVFGEMLNVAVQMKTGRSFATFGPFSLVAGACNQRYLQLWSGVA